MYRYLSTAVSALTLSVSISMSGCGAQLGDDEQPGVAQDPCMAGQTRCQGPSYQLCKQGFFAEVQSCQASETCDNVWGCVAANGCGSGADLIYVLDRQGIIHSFNPRNGKNEFRDVGKPSCPWQYTNLNSMAVDRHAQAWISTQLGDLMTVDLHSLSCKMSEVKPWSESFLRFGMGFMSQAQTNAPEYLFLSGGYDDTVGKAKFGLIDVEKSSLFILGKVPAEFTGGELTGTGAGELYAYYPTAFYPTIARLNWMTGAHEKTWTLPWFSGKVGAFAFAHWGGRMYLFTTVGGNSKVQIFDPATGRISDLLSNLPFEILGAGVSTCAPLVIG